MRLLVLTIALVLSFSAPSFAEEIPEHFVPVGPTGMGGASTAIANDENAIWTNPAGISRVRKARSRRAVHFSKFPNLVMGANSDSKEFYSLFKGGEDSVESAMENSENLSEGSSFWARAAAWPVMMYDMGRGNPGAFALYSNTTAKAVVEKDSPEEASMQMVSDLGAVISFAFTNKTNRFSIGFNIRPLSRYAYEDQMPSSELTNKTAMQDRMKAGANKSTGVGLDMGVIYTVGDFWYPTIGFSILNIPGGCKDDYLNPFSEKREKICGTKFTGEFNNEDALSVLDPTDVRAGISITPRVSRKIGMRLGLDAHHLPVGSTLKGIEVSKLIHGGVEVFTGNPLLLPPFALRVGAGQGFYTTGFVLRMGFMSLDFASYGRDISTTSTPMEDRRYMGSLSFEF